jgi:hypothetical protein
MSTGLAPVQIKPARTRASAECGPASATATGDRTSGPDWGSHATLPTAWGRWPTCACPRNASSAERSGTSC